MLENAVCIRQFFFSTVILMCCVPNFYLIKTVKIKCTGCPRPTPMLIQGKIRFGYLISILNNNNFVLSILLCLPLNQNILHPINLECSNVGRNDDCQHCRYSLCSFRSWIFQRAGIKHNIRRTSDGVSKCMKPIWLYILKIAHFSHNLAEQFSKCNNSVL